MAKVVRRILTSNYTFLNPDILAVGKPITFDCYIKRYNDYVVIIEAGTILSESLMQKIRHQDAIYVLNSDSEKIKEYQYPVAEENPVDGSSKKNGDAIKKKALGLAEILSDEIVYEKHIQTVYTTTSELMELIFDQTDEKLPLEEISSCAKHIAECVSVGINPMPILLKMTPEEYTTHHHSTNVAFFSAILAHMIGMSKEEITELAYTALLHDIGKLRIDKKILLKPDRLNEEEYEIIKRHSRDGYAILQANGITNPKILDGVLYHHEKLDGTGYPKKLRTKMIPRSARLIGMCDTFDALTTKRTFRTNYTSYEALLLMKQEMGSQFDEQYTDTFIHLLRQ